MPKYKFSVGDRVFLLRSSNNPDEEIYRACLGEVIDLNSIDHTPYCYETVFDNDENSRQVHRQLHWEQIGLVSDSRDYRLNQIVRYDPEKSSEWLEVGINRMGEQYGYLALVYDIHKKGDRIKLYSPEGGLWGYMTKEKAEELLTPLTPEEVENNSPFVSSSQERSKLLRFLKAAGERIDFRLYDYKKCTGCQDWVNPDNCINVYPSSFICHSCTETYTYECELCEKEYSFSDSPFKLYNSPDDPSLQMKVCRHCQDTRIFRCRGCSTVFMDKKHYYFNSDRLCFSCYDIACINNMASPPRMLGRGTISKLLMPDDKRYQLNKSKTPVAVEIECVHDEYHTDDDGEYYINGYPKNWSDVYDGSISEGGREFIMMPEVGDDALKTVSEFCDWALENGFYTDNSCGIHVHTDAFYSGVSELKGILLVAKALEPFIYKMLPQERSTSRYSAHMSEKVSTEDILDIKNIGEFCNLWYNGMNSTNASTEKYNDSRYRGLNMHSRMLHGTIEYRYHHGTLNSEHITNWMIFCLAISDFGANLLNRDTYKRTVDLFINRESKDFSDYLLAMNAKSLIPYVEEMITYNNPSPDVVAPNWASAIDVDGI